MRRVSMVFALAAGLAGPSQASSEAACEAANGVFEVVAERYEEMKAGGGALMLSLARIAMAATAARGAAEEAGWTAETLDTLVKIQESPATDGKGGFSPTAESSPDYVLGLAKTLAVQLETPCAGYEFAALP